VNPLGSALIYSTYLGGSSGEEFAGPIAIDGAGNAYVTGDTTSTDFPITPGAFQTSDHPNNAVAFVTKLNPSGSALVYSTYLGGSGGDGASGIAIDGAGNAYLSGGTGSTDFPITPDAFQSTNNAPICSRCGPGSNGFFTILNTSGSALVYSTYLGGSGGADGASAIAIDVAGNAYLTGNTYSTDFPITPGAFQTTYPPGANANPSFVAKFGTNPPPECSNAAASEPTLWPPNNKFVSESILDVTDPNSEAITITITSIRQDEPVDGNCPDGTGVGTSTANVLAERSGNGKDGRVYHIGFTATDTGGATCSGGVTVCVPHDQGKGSACVDEGPLFDSTVCP